MSNSKTKPTLPVKPSKNSFLDGKGITTNAKSNLVTGRKALFESKISDAKTEPEPSVCPAQTTNEKADCSIIEKRKTYFEFGANEWNKKTVTSSVHCGIVEKRKIYFESDANERNKKTVTRSTQNTESAAALHHGSCTVNTITDRLESDEFSSSSLTATEVEDGLSTHLRSPSLERKDCRKCSIIEKRKTYFESGANECNKKTVTRSVQNTRSGAASQHGCCTVNKITDRLDSDEFSSSSLTATEVEDGLSTQLRSPSLERKDSRRKSRSRSLSPRKRCLVNEITGSGLPDKLPDQRIPGFRDRDKKNSSLTTDRKSAQRKSRSRSLSPRKRCLVNEITGSGLPDKLPDQRIPGFRDRDKKNSSLTTDRKSDQTEVIIKNANSDSIRQKKDHFINKMSEYRDSKHIITLKQSSKTTVEGDFVRTGLSTKRQLLKGRSKDTENALSDYETDSTRTVETRPTSPESVCDFQLNKFNPERNIYTSDYETDTTTDHDLSFTSLKSERSKSGNYTHREIQDSTSKEIYKSMADDSIQKHRNDGIYVKTRAYHAAKRKLESEKIAVIKGTPQKGKTSLCLELLAEKKDSYEEILVVPSLDVLHAVLSANISQLIFIDDRFWTMKMLDAKNHEWVSSLLSHCITKGKKSFVLACSSEKLGKFHKRESSIFSPDKIIDLDSERFGLNEFEIKQIFCSRLKSKNGDFDFTSLLTVAVKNGHYSIALEMIKKHKFTTDVLSTVIMSLIQTNGDDIGAKTLLKNILEFDSECVAKSHLLETISGRKFKICNELLKSKWWQQDDLLATLTCAIETDTEDYSLLYSLVKKIKVAGDECILLAAKLNRDRAIKLLLHHMTYSSETIENSLISNVEYIGYENTVYNSLVENAELTPKVLLTAVEKVRLQIVKDLIKRKQWSTEVLYKALQKTLAVSDPTEDLLSICSLLLKENSTKNVSKFSFEVAKAEKCKLLHTIVCNFIDDGYEQGRILRCLMKTNIQDEKTAVKIVSKLLSNKKVYANLEYVEIAILTRRQLLLKCLVSSNRFIKEDLVKLVHDIMKKLCNKEPNEYCEVYRIIREAGMLNDKSLLQLSVELDNINLLSFALKLQRCTPDDLEQAFNKFIIDSDPDTRSSEVLKVLDVFKDAGTPISLNCLQNATKRLHFHILEGMLSMNEWATKYSVHKVLLGTMLDAIMLNPLKSTDRSKQCLDLLVRQYSVIPKESDNQKIREILKVCPKAIPESMR